MSLCYKTESYEIIYNIIFRVSDLQMFISGSRRLIRPFQRQQFSEDYDTKHRKEHDEDEETDIGALFGAGRRRAPLHRVDTALA